MKKTVTVTINNRRHVYGIGWVCTICGKAGECEHPASEPKTIKLK
ncbi:MAG: hypothetical protein NTV01_07370 [Bacteroidia bacterium]|nr:hypothetical protein [Bacteroidia bacterium]